MMAGPKTGPPWGRSHHHVTPKASDPRRQTRPRVENDEAEEGGRQLTCEAREGIRSPRTESLASPRGCRQLKDVDDVVEKRRVMRKVKMGRGKRI